MPLLIPGAALRLHSATFGEISPRLVPDNIILSFCIAVLKHFSRQGNERKHLSDLQLLFILFHCL